jgi:hypothetical protein
MYEFVRTDGRSIGFQGDRYSDTDIIRALNPYFRAETILEWLPNLNRLQIEGSMLQNTSDPDAYPPSVDHIVALLRQKYPRVVINLLE